MSLRGSQPASPGEPDLRAAARAGGRVGLVAGLVVQSLSVVTTIVLARILTKSEFGLIAAANSVVLVTSVITQVGVGPALVKERQLTDRYVATMFWVALAVSGAAAAFAAVLSPVLARLVGLPRAAPYIAVLSLLILLTGVASVPRGLLSRQLRFRPVYRTDAAQAVLYTGLQVGLAAGGLGAWAVVLGQVAAAAFGLAVLTRLSGFRPSRAFDRSLVRRELRFGGGVFGQQALSTVSKNIDYWTVGRIGGATALGVYYVAYVLPNIVRQRFTILAGEVLTPVFARLESVDRERRAYLTSLELHLAVGLPAMVGIAVLAQPIIVVFFGRSWTGAVAPLRLLALAAAVEFATQAATTVFLARGVPGRNATIEAIRLAAIAAGVAAAVALDGGPTAVAGAVLAGTAMAALASQVLVARDVGVPLRAAFTTAVAVAVPTLAMAGAVTGLTRLVHGPALVELAAGVVTGVAAALAVAALAFRPTLRRVGAEVRTLVRPAR